MKNVLLFAVFENVSFTSPGNANQRKKISDNMKKFADQIEK